MKAIITDLDRTLLHTDKTISEYTIHVMQRCHDKNIAIMAATARPERSIQTYRKLKPSILVMIMMISNRSGCAVSALLFPMPLMLCKKKPITLQAVMMRTV